VIFAVVGRDAQKAFAKIATPRTGVVLNHVKHFIGTEHCLKDRSEESI